MVELCIKNMERILLVDRIMYYAVFEMYPTLRDEAKINSANFRIERPTKDLAIGQITHDISNYFLYLQFKEGKKDKEFQTELFFKQERDLLNTDFSDLILKSEHNFFFENINKLFGLEYEFFDNILYAEIWQFISDITSEGLEFSMIAYILLSEKRKLKFKFR